MVRFGDTAWEGEEAGGWMPRWPGPGKYDPLGDYLAAQPPTTATVRLTLVEIEAILGAPLPMTAQWTGFWTNYARNPPSRAWRRVGWRVIRQTGNRWVEAVTFVREPPDSTP
jgi:hypothetical protein